MRHFQAIFIVLILINSAVLTLSEQSRILDGHRVKIEQAPYTVHVTFKTGENHAGFCGGSIINENYILTAGHCVTTGIFKTMEKRDPSVYIVRAGSAYSNKDGDVLYVSDIFIRDGIYRGKTTHNDVAILKLKESIKLDNLTKMATKLPPSSDYDVPVDTKCYVQGWGVNPGHPNSKHLYRATVETVDTDKCNDAWKQPVHDNHHICALGYEDADACSGDSGGPLVTAKDGIQIGLVSFGSDCNNATGQPGVYTRVADNLDWIRNITGIQENHIGNNNNHNQNSNNNGGSECGSYSHGGNNNENNNHNQNSNSNSQCGSYSHGGNNNENNNHNQNSNSNGGSNSQCGSYSHGGNNNENNNHNQNSNSNGGSGCSNGGSNSGSNSHGASNSNGNGNNIFFGFVNKIKNQKN